MYRKHNLRAKFTHKCVVEKVLLKNCSRARKTCVKELILTGNELNNKTLPEKLLKSEFYSIKKYPEMR